MDDTEPENFPPPDEVLDAFQAAALLKVHPVTLRRKAVAWGVPHKRLGTEWRFLRARLLAWLDESRRHGR